MIALPVFQERVSPLMDVSSKYAIYETVDGEIRHRIDISLNTEGERQRLDKLKEIGVDTIICGAVSGCVERIINEKGIRLISMIYGPIEEIIQRYLSDSLTAYCMTPAGCAGNLKNNRGKCAGSKGIRGRRRNRTEETSE